jgi:L-methionine (R)-S-oxide reductase
MIPSSYSLPLKQLASIIEGEDDATAVMANAAALLHDAFADRFFWVGFYRVSGRELILGPFQGPVACIHIPFGRGVCGSAWQQERTLRVDDVDRFPGHIACSSLSRSEIVVPVKDTEGTVRAVIDVDSRQLAAFTPDDEAGLEEAARIIARQIYA